MKDWLPLIPSLVALVAAAVALVTPFIAAHQQQRGNWREQRRVTYNTFLATCAVRRRRLEAQAQRQQHRSRLGEDDTKERNEAREAVVAEWNKVALATDYEPLHRSAEDLMIVVDDLRRRLDEGQHTGDDDLATLQRRWDLHRADYIRHARTDLRLPGQRRRVR